MLRVNLSVSEEAGGTANDIELKIGLSGCLMFSTLLEGVVLSKGKFKTMLSIDESFTRGLSLIIARISNHLRVI